MLGLSLGDLVAPAHAAVALLILLWDIFIAGQMVQLRKAPPLFTGFTGLAALLVAPATFLLLATSFLETGRAVADVAWIWPACAIVFLLQALIATSRRLVTPLIGVPILVYDVLIATVAVARWMIAQGDVPPAPLLALSAAHASGLGIFIGQMALTSPFALQVPILSPAFPARWRASKTIRATLALYAAAWAVVISIELPRGVLAIRSYGRYSTARLTEHPPGDFVVGVKVFPDLDGVPPPLSLRHDLALVDTMGVDAVSVTIGAGGTRIAALDSVARVLDAMRRDSTLLIVTLGYPGDARGAWRRSPEAYAQARLSELDRIVRRLQPDIILPADAPYGRGVRALGVLPVRFWEDYLSRAAALVHHLRPRTQVGIAAGGFDAPDSALYAWATSPESPLDVAGFALFPGFRGETSLRARTDAADRWMLLAPHPLKPHWVFATGGFPAVHGEESQAWAIQGALAWATARPAIRGLVVVEPGDWDSLTGLRAGDGHLRRAVGVITRAIRGLAEGS